MNTFTKQRFVLLVWGQIAFGLAQAQGAFVNLDFESANVPPVPAGQLGANVTVSDGLSGWSASIGNQIGHNDFPLAGDYVGILGPQWDSSQILQGNYTVSLYSQFNFGSAQPGARGAIWQMGTIPGNSQSIRFFERDLGGSGLQVTYNNQIIPTVVLGAGANYTVFGGDISAFAGQTGELRFTAPDSPLGQQGAGLLDGITFSVQPIPEPSIGVLLVCGLALLVRRRRRRICSNWQP